MGDFFDSLTWYGGALLLLWLLGRRTAMRLPEDGKGLSFLRHVITPLATLIVISGGYQVLLLLGGPFLSKTGKTIYNWVFVVAIISAALWLILAWLRYSAPLGESLEALTRGNSQSLFSRPKCGGSVAVGMRFCGYCGAPVHVSRE